MTTDTLTVTYGCPVCGHEMPPRVKPDDAADCPECEEFPYDAHGNLVHRDMAPINVLVDAPSEIEVWAWHAIDGMGGMRSMEYHEMAVSQYDDKLSAALWILRCLGNNPSPETQDVVDAIVERRQELAQKAGTR